MSEEDKSSPASFVTSGAQIAQRRRHRPPPPAVLTARSTTTPHSSAEMLEKPTVQSTISSFGLSSLTNVFILCRFWLLPSAGAGGERAQILKVVFFLSSNPDDCLKSPPVCAVFAGFCCVADSPSSLARLSSARFGLVWQSGLL